MIYKIGINRYILYSLVLLLPGALFSQQPAADYGVTTIHLKKQYLLSVKADSSKRMIALRQLIPTLQLDLKYADTGNFTKQRMYPGGIRETFLRLPAARSLKNVQAELAAKGFGLKIFDAYRPYGITVKFWELIGDERYVAKPTKGSGHNRGLAVDLTIIHLRSQQELDMGTGFDNFTDTASHKFSALPKEVLKNRQFLKDIMERHGFKPIDTEWWHYYWPNDRDYEVLDLRFEEFR